MAEKTLHEGHRSRMREAVERDKDMASFSDYEVLEYLLSFLIPRKDTNPIAHRLIDEFGSLYGVLQAPSEELFAIPNMTQNAANLLPNIYSIIRKSEMSRLKKRPCITRVAEAVELLRPYFLGRNEERVYCAVLDLNDRVIQVALVGEGIADFTIIQNNKILALASRNKAKKIILAHNHPAGSLIPSEQDILSTNSLFLILQSIDATLADHLIFNTKDYFSFYEHGLFEKIALGTDRMFGKNSYEEMRAKRAEGLYISESEINKSEMTE